MRQRNPQNNQANTEEAFSRIRLPRRSEGEMFAKTIQLLGGDQLKAFCEDGKERVIRIPGKMRKSVWIRENDIIIVKLWDFQPSKGDVVWRYQGFQINYLEKNGHLQKLQAASNAAGQ